MGVGRLLFLYSAAWAAAILSARDLCNKYTSSCAHSTDADRPQNAKEYRRCLRYVLSCIGEETADGLVVSSESFQAFCSAASFAVGIPFSESCLQKYNPSEFLSERHMLRFIQRHLHSTIKSAEGRATLERFCWDEQMKAEFVRQRLRWSVVGPTEELAFQLWRFFVYASGGSKTISSAIAAWVQCHLSNELRPTHLSSSRASLSVISRDRLSYWQLLRADASLLSVTSEAEEARHLQTVQEMLLEAEKRVITQGLLEKRGHIRRNWKRRWFVLSPGLLQYYTDSNLRTLKGTCHITRESSVKHVRGTSSRDCRFTLSCGRTGKVFEISAASEEERRTWVAYIQFAIKHPSLTTMEHFAAIEEDHAALFMLSQSSIGRGTSSLEASLLHSSNILSTVFCFAKCLFNIK